MRLCRGSGPWDEDEVEALALWAQGAWDYLAMGNYPYPSPYILNGAGLLPAFPVRVACSHLADPGLQGAELLGAMASAVGVFYNFSGGLDCFDFNQGSDPDTQEDGEFWSYQFCTEQYMPMTRDGVNDMFWDQPWDEDEAIRQCEEQWGVAPRPLHATIEWGGKRIDTLSNIVFSNGMLDPWSGGGVLSSLSDSLVAVVISEGAHHLDLMFSHPLDPPSVKEARKLEDQLIAKWAAGARARSVAAAARKAALGRRAGLPGSVTAQGGAQLAEA